MFLQLKLNSKIILFTVQVCFLAALLVLVYLVASGRDVDLTDEGWYLYEAWAAWGSSEYVPSTWPLRMNVGYLLGLPLIFTEAPNIFTLRLFSLLIWLGSFGVLFYGYARKTGGVRFFPFVLGLVPVSILIPTLSYQTFPFALFAAAGGFLLLALEIKDRTLSSFLAGLMGMSLMLSIIAYTPSLAAVLLALLSAFAVLPDRKQRRIMFWGILFGAIAVIAVILPGCLAQGDHIFVPVNIGERLRRGFARLPEIGALLGACLLLGATSVFLIKRVPRYVESSRLLSFLIKIAVISLAGIFLFITVKLIRDSHLYGYNPRWVFLCLAFILAPICCWWAKLESRDLTIHCLPLFWLLLIALTQSILGDNQSPFYFYYLAPAVLGAIFVIIDGTLLKRAGGMTPFLVES